MGSAVYPNPNITICFCKITNVFYEKGFDATSEGAVMLGEPERREGDMSLVENVSFSQYSFCPQIEIL